MSVVGLKWWGESITSVNMSKSWTWCGKRRRLEDKRRLFQTFSPIVLPCQTCNAKGETKKKKEKREKEPGGGGGVTVRTFVNVFMWHFRSFSLHRYPQLAVWPRWSQNYADGWAWHVRCRHYVAVGQSLSRFVWRQAREQVFCAWGFCGLCARRSCCCFLKINPSV